MCEKIYALLLRLYPASFRKGYQAEALELLRDRFRDERGFFKRARLGWDLLVDLFAGLPPAYRNTYAADPSPILIDGGIPAFRILHEEHLGRGPILIGSTLSVIVLVAFAALLGHPNVNPPLPDPHGRLSPIEAVMRRLSQPPSDDPSAGSFPETALPASAQGNGSQAPPSPPSTSSQNRSQAPQSAVPQSARSLGVVAKRTPTLTLSYLPASPAPGSTVNFTATVMGAGTGPMPTGDVRFFDRSVLLSVGKLNHGAATVRATVPDLKTHSFRATYYGDSSYHSASSVAGTR